MKRLRRWLFGSVSDANYTFTHYQGYGDANFVFSALVVRKGDRLDRAARRFMEELR